MTYIMFLILCSLDEHRIGTDDFFSVGWRSIPQQGVRMSSNYDVDVLPNLTGNFSGKQMKYITDVWDENQYNLKIWPTNSDLIIKTTLPAFIHVRVTKEIIYFIFGFISII